MLELSPIERAVLVMYHQEECTYEGIALALELPINTVRTHLHRGRKKLGELVQARTSAGLAKNKPEGPPLRAAMAGA